MKKKLIVSFFLGGFIILSLLFWKQFSCQPAVEKDLSPFKCNICNTDPRNGLVGCYEVEDIDRDGYPEMFTFEFKYEFTVDRDCDICLKENPCL